MILVTGAAGKTGLAVIRQLHATGAEVRALVRRNAQRDLAFAAGATDVVVADLTHEAALIEALRDARAIYHICPNMSPHEVDIGRSIMGQARRAEVERFVYHSVLHPQIEAMPHHWAKLRTEELLFQSDLDFTILQPAAYMQNLLPQWRAIREQGLYSVPYAESTRLGMVDLEDVAEAAARVLTEPGHGGATYELASSEVLSQVVVAEILSAALGRKVSVDVISRENWATRARADGLSKSAVVALFAMFRYYERFGFYGNATVLRHLLGREPTTLEQFCERHI